MIGYPITPAQLLEEIEAYKPGWVARAGALTEQARVQGSFDGITSIWSEIKPVFMRLQGESKCAYCERKLEAEAYGAIEEDIEHFRPKNRVTAWKPTKELVGEGVMLAKAPAKSEGGYFLLAHNALNYAVGCKPCNSTLKADRFPVAYAHDLNGDDPRNLNSFEKPYLLFPVGDWGDDPEAFFAFHGLSPQALSKTGFDRLRSLATIEFFSLDDGEKRKNLFLERARIILSIYPQLETLASSAPSATRKSNAVKVVRALISSNSPHSNCARSFKRLFERHPDRAQMVFEAASNFVESAS